MEQAAIQQIKDLLADYQNISSVVNGLLEELSKIETKERVLTKPDELSELLEEALHGIVNYTDIDDLLFAQRHNIMWNDSPGLSYLKRPTTLLAGIRTKINSTYDLCIIHTNNPYKEKETIVNVAIIKREDATYVVHAYCYIQSLE